MVICWVGTYAAIPHPPCTRLQTINVVHANLQYLAALSAPSTQPPIMSNAQYVTPCHCSSQTGRATASLVGTLSPAAHYAFNWLAYSASPATKAMATSYRAKHAATPTPTNTPTPTTPAPPAAKSSPAAPTANYSPTPSPAPPATKHKASTLAARIAVTCTLVNACNAQLQSQAVSTANTTNKSKQWAVLNVQE